MFGDAVRRDGYVPGEPKPKRIMPADPTLCFCVLCIYLRSDVMLHRSLHCNDSLEKEEDETQSPAEATTAPWS